jgi:hypothetical protein
MEFSGSAFVPGAREKRKGSLDLDLHHSAAFLRAALHAARRMPPNGLLMMT